MMATPTTGQSRTVQVSVQRVENIGRGRIRVKIRQTDFNLSGMEHNGKSYVVSKNIGRGRYIMRQEG